MHKCKDGTAFHAHTVGKRFIRASRDGHDIHRYKAVVECWRPKHILNHPFLVSTVYNGPFIYERRHLAYKQAKKIAEELARAHKFSADILRPSDSKPNQKA